MWLCWSRIQDAGWEWLLVIPIALFGNWIEWAAHRYILHRPVKGLEMIYKRHCTVHHQFFTHHDLTYRGHKEWRALLFPPFAPLGFVLAALPPACLLGLLISANAGYIAVFTMAAYYLMYEGLHTLSHLDDERHPYLKYIPLINTVRRMHTVHHVLGFMQTRTFSTSPFRSATPCSAPAISTAGLSARCSTATPIRTCARTCCRPTPALPYRSSIGRGNEQARTV